MPILSATCFTNKLSLFSTNPSLTAASPYDVPLFLVVTRSLSSRVHTRTHREGVPLCVGSSSVKPLHMPLSSFHPQQRKHMRNNALTHWFQRDPTFHLPSRSHPCRVVLQTDLRTSAVPVPVPLAVVIDDRSDVWDKPGKDCLLQVRTRTTPKQHTRSTRSRIVPVHAVDDLLASLGLLQCALTLTGCQHLITRGTPCRAVAEHWAGSCSHPELLVGGW